MEAIRLRYNIILGFILFLLAYLVLDQGGRSAFTPSLLLIVLLPLGLFFYALSPKLKWTNLYIPLFVFLIISFFAAIFSISKYESFIYFILLFGLATIFFIVSQLNFSEKHFKFIFYCIFGLAIIVCFSAIYFFLTSQLTGTFSRMIGTFYWPNPFAGFLLFCLPISLFLFWQSQGKSRYWFLAACSLILAVFVLTYSKGAFLSFLLPFGLLVWHFKSTLKKEFLLKIICLVVLTVGLVYGLLYFKKNPYLITKQPLKAKEEGQVTSLTRLSYMKGALKIFRDNVLIGTGPASFYLVYPRYQKTPVEYAKYAHNFYLETLAETGIFGFLSFVAFVLGIILIGFKLLIKKTEIFALPIFAGILGSLLHTGIDFDYAFWAIFLLFWFVAGLLVNLYIKNKSNKPSFNFHWIIFLLGFLAFVFGIFLFFSNYNLERAKNFEQEGNLDEAKVYYEKSLNILNKNPMVYYYLGRIEYVKGNQKEAEKLALMAIKKNPENPLNYQLLGRIYFTKGDTQKAEENFKKAIELDPKNNLGFYIDLANLYLKSKQKTKAKQAIESILPLYSTNVVNTLHLKVELPAQIETLKKLLKEAQGG